MIVMSIMSLYFEMAALKGQVQNRSRPIKADHTYEGECRVKSRKMQNRGHVSYLFYSYIAVQRSEL